MQRSDYVFAPMDTVNADVDMAKCAGPPKSSTAPHQYVNSCEMGVLFQRRDLSTAGSIPLRAAQHRHAAGIVVNCIHKFIF